MVEGQELEVGQVGSANEAPVSETIANAPVPQDGIAPEASPAVAAEELPAAAAEDAAVPAPVETVPDAPIASEPESGMTSVVPVDAPAEEAPAGLDAAEVPTPIVRTTDDIRDDEWAREVLTKDDGSQHQIGWLAWGDDKILCKPFSYAGPLFLCADLDEATRLVPVFG